MPAKPNLLIVGDYNRKDFINLFQESRNVFNLYFLEFASPKEIKNSHYQAYGKAIFWGDYKNAFDLLDKIKPHKVLFLFIESYYHVMLNLTCKIGGIPTYHIDHGLRDENANIRLQQYFKHPKAEPVLLKQAQRIWELIPRLRARAFLLRSARALPLQEAKFFNHFYKVRKANHYLDTFKLIPSPLRVADAYIAFSPKVYAVHQQQDFLPKEKKVYYIGVPYFDHLASIQPAPYFREQIVFIDQGLMTREILGWNLEQYHIFIKSITRICASRDIELYVKLHPIQTEQEETLWAANPNVTVINNDQLEKLLPETQLIIGFFSTYLLPLMALYHTTVFTLENHPCGKLDVSKSFIDAGVAHPVYSIQELEWALDHIQELHQKQLPNKAKFTEEWMYKFDGKAGERLREILLSNEL